MPIGQPPAWRRIVPTLATVAGVVLFVAAGNWQRGRMHEKEALAAQLAAATRAAPEPLPRTVADWSAWRYRPVVVEGVFDAAHQILVDNRVQGGVVGYAVVTPLKLADGRAVLVDRGFAPAGRTRATLPDVPPPPGDVVVRGRVNLPSTPVELVSAAPQGNLWPHLDPRRFAEATGMPVLPVVVEATDPAGPGDSLARERPAPDFGIETHWIYMLQWYSFAALAIALWLWFWLRPRVWKA